MPTIRDVAKSAGVSTSTVSLAFSDPKRVGAKTLERIQRAAAELGYVADPLAQSLARGRSRLIGLITPNVGNPFFGDIRRELENFAIEHNHFVLVSDSSGKSTRERDVLEHLIGLKVAGVVIAPNGQGKDYAEFIQSFKIPIVCFDQRVEGITRDFIGSDNRLATAILTEHLLQLGHRRIAFIAGPESLYTARGRLAGFRETMAGAGVEIDPGLVVDGNFTNSGAYAQAMRLLTRADRPTAIIGANNVMVLAALQAVQELGFRCPDDVSLAMVDDVPWSNVITPKLTTVVQDTVKMGSLIAHQLLHRILTPEGAAEPARDFILAPRFVPGNSTRAI